MHILICFAKGFGLLGGIVLGIALLVYLVIKLSRWIAARTGWDRENTAVALAVGVGLLFIGTIMSLGFCGILK